MPNYTQDDFDLWLQNPDLTEAESTNAVTKKDIKKLIQAAEIDLAAEDVKTYLKLLENQADYKVNSRFFEFLIDIFQRHNRIVWSDWKSYHDEFSENFNKVLVDFGAEFTLTEEEIEKWDRFISPWTFDLIKNKLRKQNLRAVMLVGGDDNYNWIIFRKEKLSLIEDEILDSLLDIDMWS